MCFTNNEIRSYIFPFIFLKGIIRILWISTFFGKKLYSIKLNTGSEIGIYINFLLPDVKTRLKSLHNNINSVKLVPICGPYHKQ